MHPDRMKRMFDTTNVISNVKIVASTDKYVIVTKDDRYKGVFSGNKIINRDQK